MGATGGYFRHIKDAVVSIFDGMAVTASHLIRKPYTIQYPDRIATRVQDTLPFRYRGILDVDLEICTGCLACDRACPIDCIAMAIEKNAQTREITISQFDIDIAKCMYCGLCSEPCPTGAIHHTTEFEGADYSLESLIRRFIVEPTVAYKPKKGPEPDPDTAKLLERGMKYVDEWAQPGSDKPPAAKPAPAPKPAAPAAAKPSTPAVKPAASPVTNPASPTPTPSSGTSASKEPENAKTKPEAAASVTTKAADTPAEPSPPTAAKTPPASVESSTTTQPSPSDGKAEPDGSEGKQD